MEKPRWITIVVLVVLLLIAWWWWRSRDGSNHAGVLKRESPDLLLNRAWVGTPPKDDDKRAFRHGLAVIDALPIGLFQRVTAYRWEAERFDHQLEGNKLSMHFPQSGQRARVSFQISACNDVPSFDLCLTLDKNPWGGPRRYYGQRHPDKRRRALLEQLRQRAAHEL